MKNDQVFVVVVCFGGDLLLLCCCFGLFWFSLVWFEEERGSWSRATAQLLIVWVMIAEKKGAQQKCRGRDLGWGQMANAHSLGGPAKIKRGKVVRAAFAGAGKADLTVPGLKQ